MNGYFFVLSVIFFKKYHMKKTILCLFLLFLGMTQFAKAQDKGKRMSAGQMKGTYQVEFLKSDKSMMVSITEELLTRIDEKRDAVKTTYLSVSETCRVKILSKKDMYTARFTEEYSVVENFQ